MPESVLFAERALLPGGWARDVLFRIDGAGSLSRVAAGVGAGAGAAPRAAGPVVPGMPNLHSHAFQRAMAGLAERAGPGANGGDDSFWTWREVMYGFLGRLSPDHLEAVAAQLYVEMLKAGYTAVGEFHYLHHDPEGRPYNDPAEMSRRILAAARLSGIGLTHLPVLYGFGGFGGAPAGEGQRRLLNHPQRFLALIEALRGETESDPQVRLGIAPHSLRAVTPESLGAALDGLDGFDPDAPVHIHVAEQRKEVEDCIAWCGQRPVEWLLTNMDLGPRWCLVHATHMTDEETRALAACGAVAGLCPTTEANLGDGVFPAAAYLAAGGAFGIGSDSHISVSPIEELRWLEYSQRWTARRRNILHGGAAAPSVGAVLFQAALAGGARALGRPIGRLEAGGRADLVVLDPESPQLVGRDEAVLLDVLVFAGNDNPVRDVMVGGRWVVRDRHHGEEAAVLAGYRAALAELTG
ncbi:MAG: formimidoylglutamate deiminase [Rhodospirillales bacterium]|nr:formimidoylglutamate deiminase [Rhodospirillales bacterium]